MYIPFLNSLSCEYECDSLAGPRGIEPRISGSAGQRPVLVAPPMSKTPSSDMVSRLRAHTEGIRHKDRIINTLLWLKRQGLSEGTLHTTSQKLNQLSKNSYLMNPTNVLDFIANHKSCGATKKNLWTVTKTSAK
jgi:hypothetical protein